MVLAGDNAIVIGLAAAGLPSEQRKKAILIGVLAATVLRIFFAAITVKLLAIVGLLLAGGILLLWVCWKMWRELRTSHDDEQEAAEALSNSDINQDKTIAGRAPRKTLAQAAIQGGTHAAEQVLASVQGRPRTELRYRDKGTMATIGRRAAVAEIPWAPAPLQRLHGSLAWLAWLGLKPQRLPKVWSMSRRGASLWGRMVRTGTDRTFR